MTSVLDFTTKLLRREPREPGISCVCGCWLHARTADEARQHKMQLVAVKLHLWPGMRVMDLSGGPDDLARYLESDFGCTVVRGLSATPERFDRAVVSGVEHLPAVHEQLRDTGRCFLETLTSSLLPLARAVERGWLIEDWHNASADYERTLSVCGRLQELQRVRAERLQLWQVVLTRER